MFQSDVWMLRELLIWKVCSGVWTAVLVEIPLLTGLPAANQLTSAKGTDWLDRQTRVALLDRSSALDGGKTVRTGGGRLEPGRTWRNSQHHSNTTLHSFTLNITMKKNWKKKKIFNICCSIARPKPNNYCNDFIFWENIWIKLKHLHEGNDLMKLKKSSDKIIKKMYQHRYKIHISQL